MLLVCTATVLDTVYRAHPVKDELIVAGVDAAWRKRWQNTKPMT